jgi:hypothetical protein
MQHTSSILRVDKKHEQQKNANTKKNTKNTKNTSIKIQNTKNTRCLKGVFKRRVFVFFEFGMKESPERVAQAMTGFSGV